jgi:hypothetical protein
LTENRVEIQTKVVEFRDARDSAKYHNRNPDILRGITNRATGSRISIGENGAGGPVC